MIKKYRFTVQNDKVTAITNISIQNSSSGGQTQLGEVEKNMLAKYMIIMNDTYHLLDFSLPFLI